MIRMIINLFSDFQHAVDSDVDCCSAYRSEASGSGAATSSKSSHNQTESEF